VGEGESKGVGSMMSRPAAVEEEGCKYIAKSTVRVNALGTIGANHDDAVIRGESGRLRQSAEFSQHEPTIKHVVQPL
jgi:predicted methyltransferase